jgi:hypothetical protein
MRATGGSSRAADPPLKQVVFIQNAIPPLRDGTYALSATQTIPGQDPGSFSAAATFVVSGERFTIAPTEVDSVFPPNLANGELDGVLAHVVLNRRTLPWERQIDTPGSGRSYPDSSWLAVLVCDDATAPKPQTVTAKDLVPDKTPISVQESTVTGTGTLVATTLSYGAALLHELEYGETPDDPCTVIDLPIAAFDQIAPAAVDLQYLAHIREVDTTDGADSESTSEQHAVVIANRVPTTQGPTRAFLVSLEGMADYLPAADGARSTAIAASIDTVRLIVYLSWTFTANNQDETLQKLLQGLNARRGGTPVTTLTLPIDGDPPSSAQLAQASTHQAAGSLVGDDAQVLVQNALLMGYVPFDHHLRHGGSTVSFYRGPLLPLAVPRASPPYYPGPDAANAYDAQTGLFDVSYGAAWQLGQLLALQSSGMANALYAWKRAVTLQQAIAAEDAILTKRLQGTPVLSSFLGRRRAAAAAPPPPLPDDVATWFANLATLEGVPFNYLVPDERLLPPESIRFFQIDQNWIDALIDGAFSIGRATVSDQSLEVLHAPAVRSLARAGAGLQAANRRAAATANPGGPVSGFLLRSQALAGWPNLRVNGYRQPGAAGPINAVRIAQLSSDTMLCLFDDVVASIALREPPEQQHHGVEGSPGAYYTTLRSVAGGPGSVAAGQQYTTSPTTFKSPCDPDGTQPWTCISTRADGRTLLIAAAAAAIQSRLSSGFGQTFPFGFTAAELALELTKGVVEVEFTR